MQIGNGQIELCINLYLSGFDKKKGTIVYISKCLDSPYGQTRTFLKKLVNDNVLVHGGYDEINGKVYNVYSLDKDRLLELLKQNQLFKKMGAIIYEDYEVVFRDLEGWHKFDREEIKKLQEVKNGS